jgi:hypothetical protein
VQLMTTDPLVVSGDAFTDAPSRSYMRMFKQNKRHPGWRRRIIPAGKSWLVP